MKHTVRNILLIVFAALLLVSFAGCKKEETVAPSAQSTLQIDTVKIIPLAYLDEPYDLYEVILAEKGVEYSATACYTDVTLNAETNEYVFEEKHWR